MQVSKPTYILSLLVAIIVGVAVSYAAQNIGGNGTDKDPNTGLPQGVASATPNPIGTTDEERIMNRVKARTEAAVGVGSATYKFLGIQNNFGAVKTSFSDGPMSYTYLKKVNGIWVIVYEGQSASPSAIDQQKYEIPTDFIQKISASS